MEKDIGALFSRRLKQLMAARPDLDTQVKLAAASGLTQTTIGRMLNRRASPMLENVAAIADVFGLTIGQMIGQSDIENMPETLNYDRRAVARLTTGQRTFLERYLRHSIHAFTEMNRLPPGVDEKRFDNRRKKTVKLGPNVPNNRQNMRRASDSLEMQK